MSRLTPSLTTIKKLFALSGNLCAFNHNDYRCTNSIIDSDNIIIGSICHIEAANKGWVRYNPNSDDEERRDFDNLILFCPNHHKKVDSDPSFTVEILRQMKLRHETLNKNKRFEIDDDIVSHLLIRIGIDTSIESNVLNNSNLPAFLIEKLLQKLDSKDVLINEKESLFKELEKKYNELGNRVTISDKQDNDLKQFLLKGDFAGAEKELINDIKRQENLAKAIQSDIAEKSFQLGILYELELRYLDAQKAYKRAVDLAPVNANYLNNLSYVTTQIGGYVEAVFLYKRLIALLSEDKKIDTSTIGVAYINLGWTYDSNGKHLLAIENYNNAVKVFGYDLSKFGLEIAGCYNNIGLAYKNLNEHQLALKHYTMSLEVLKKIDSSKEKIKCVAQALTNIASLYSLHGNFVEANRLCQASISHLKSIDLDNQIEMASTYYQLGYALYGLEKNDLAINYTIKALDIYLACFGENHNKVASCYNDLAFIYKKNGELNKAIAFSEKSLKIYIQTLGELHPYTITAKENLEKMK